MLEALLSPDVGLGVLAVCLFFDDMGFPFPTNTAIFALAVLAHTQGEAFVWPLYFLALCIAPISNSIVFYWGRHGAQKWLHTHGHKFFLPQKRIRSAQKIFQRHGEKAVFIASMIPMIRPVMAMVAGSMNVKPTHFHFWNILGVILWANILVGVGYYFGEAILPVIQHYWREGVLLVIAFFVGKHIALHFYQKRKTSSS